MAPADYHYEIHGDVIVVFDHDLGGRSVTNAAEEVIDALRNELVSLTGKRVIYRDSMGIFDELQVNPAGRFQGYSFIGERDLDKALLAISNRPRRT